MERKTKFCSCHLAVHHESGRVKWCIGQQGEWQNKIKRLVFLPVILLPLMIVIVLLTKYATAESVVKRVTRSNSENQNIENLVKQNENIGDILNTALPNEKGLEFGYEYDELGEMLPFHDRERFRREIQIIPIKMTENSIVTSTTTEGETNKLSGQSHGFWKNEMGPSEIRLLQSSIMKRYMDNSVNPCDDFYKFACGKWRNYYTIPPERNSYDTFEILRENLDNVLQELLLEVKLNEVKVDFKIMFVIRAHILLNMV
ncbi:hypothetical protein HHI36_022817 [Cryptolaemus montrouzieri]|uniref:Peptidase M13 N-terminal domain-containing protein n=1 Tax=Cryptolaemus montrouzieri TaxID=559131 RepID=A0ABD2PEH9_9CUCU